MSEPYSREFREDVVRVAHSREDGVTLERVAKDFGIHPTTLTKWLRQDRIDAGERPGASSAELAELHQLRRRNRLLKQEVEALRRAAA